MKKQFSVAAKRLIDCLVLINRLSGNWLSVSDCLVYLEQSQETVYIKYDGSNHKFWEFLGDAN